MEAEAAAPPPEAAALAPRPLPPPPPAPPPKSTPPGSTSSRHARHLPALACASTSVLNVTRFGDRPASETILSTSASESASGACWSA